MLTNYQKIKTIIKIIAILPVIINGIQEIIRKYRDNNIIEQYQQNKNPKGSR